MRRITICLFALSLLTRGGPAEAVQITLNANDALNSTSFNTGLHWSNGQAPTSANTYVVPGLTLRTPPGGGNRTFAGSSLTLAGGGILAFKGLNGNTITVNNLVLDNGSVRNYAGNGPTFTLAGNGITLGNGGGTFDTVGFTNRGIAVSAPISGNSAVTISGNGTVQLSAANSYSGNTIIKSTTLRLNNADAVQNSTVIVDADNELTFGGGVGTFNLGGLAGNFLINLMDTVGNSVNVKVGGNGQSTTVGGVLTGGGSLTKVGSGTLTLSGASSYTGGTTVNSGMLLANNTTGSATGSGAVMVTGGTLGGTGSIAGPVTINNGAISPGSSIESLSTGALTFGAASLLSYEINSGLVLGTMGDLLDSSGSLSIAPGATLAISDGGGSLLTAGTKLTMISYSGVWDGGTFAGYGNGSVFILGLNQFRIQYNDSSPGGNFLSEAMDNTAFVTLTAVPELSSAVATGLTGLIAVGIVWMGRRYGFKTFRI